MATIKTITRFSQAPDAPEEIPVTAFVLIEINNQVFKAPLSALGGEGASLPGWAENMPTADPENAGQVYASGDTLLVSEGSGG